MEQIEVRPLKPFVGSYRCSLAEADMIDEQLKENDDGLIVKEKVPRRRYVGMISEHRTLRDYEKKLIKEKQPLPANIERIEGTDIVIEHPSQRSLMLPVGIAQSLIDRGLAELVAVARRR